MDRKNALIMIEKIISTLKISDNISFERNKTEIIIVLAVYMCILMDTYLHTFIVTLSQMIPFNWSLNI